MMKYAYIIIVSLIIVTLIALLGNRLFKSKSGIATKCAYIIVSLIIVIFISLIARLIYSLAPWLILICGALFFPRPALQPAITYEEFPISVEYEVNGDARFIEDIVVCEFDGFDTMGWNEKMRQWKSYLKSGNEELYLLKTEDTVIYISCGSPSYYMNDLEYQTVDDYESLLKDGRLTVEKLSGEETIVSVITAEEAEELYDLKIINVNYSKPIVNRFESREPFGDVHFLVSFS